MTLDQAIRILDPATTTEELERIYYYGGFHGNEVTDAAINEALRIALEVMRNCYKEKSNRTLTEFCEMAGGQFKAITINVFDGKGERLRYYATGDSKCLEFTISNTSNPSSFLRDEYASAKVEQFYAIDSDVFDVVLAK